MRDREREMAEEMRLHLEHRVDQKVAAGMSPADARTAALREFGNVESMKLQARRQRRTWRLVTALRDVKFGLRLLRRSPGFAVTAVVTLALGVGANVAVFSVLRGVLLEKPAYPDPDQVVHVWRYVERMVNHPLTADDLALIRATTTAMPLLAASMQRMATLRGEAPPERAYVARVQLDFFPAYGVAAASGRWFGAGDFAPDARPVAISDALWRRQFAAGGDVLGKVIHLDDTAFTVVGVMPSGFVTDPASSIEAKAWTPMLLAPDERLLGRTVARLRADMTAADAAAQLSAILPPQNVEFFDGKINRHLGVRVVPVGTQEAEAARPGVLLLQGAALLLLVIMCANLGNVLLAHATERRRELGVRAALGAGRSRLIGQLLTEAAVIAAIGGSLAVGLAASVVPALQALAGNLLPRSAAIAVNLPELFVALGVSWATALAFAGIPAWLISRAVPLDAFRGTTTNSNTAGAAAFRASLISVQVLLALVALVGSGL
jgi:predicted permease